eukprot:1323595-Pyramimonas_sp.AAC.1
MKDPPRASWSLQLRQRPVKKPRPAPPRFHAPALAWWRSEQRPAVGLTDQESVRVAPPKSHAPS